MAYEQVKAVINARMKQWKEQKEQCERIHADISLITALEASVQACGIILQDLEISHDILEKQG